MYAWNFNLKHSAQEKLLKNLYYSKNIQHCPSIHEHMINNGRRKKEKDTKVAKETELHPLVLSLSLSLTHTHTYIYIYASESMLAAA